MKQLIFLTFSYLTVCFYTEHTVLSEEYLPISLCFKSYLTWAPGHEYPFPRVYKLGFRVGLCKCHPQTWGLQYAFLVLVSFFCFFLLLGEKFEILAATEDGLP